MLRRDPSRELRRRQYDLAIDLQGLFRSGWLTRQTGAMARVGFDYAREGAPAAYTHLVPQETPERHAVERYLDVADALGCGRGPVVFEFGIATTTSLPVKAGKVCRRYLAGRRPDLCRRCDPGFGGGGRHAKLVGCSPRIRRIIGILDAGLR